MIDYKHFGHYRRNKLFDEIATDIAYIVAIVLVVLYGLGAMP